MPAHSCMAVLFHYNTVCTYMSVDPKESLEYNEVTCQCTVQYIVYVFVLLTITTILKYVYIATHTENVHPPS